MTAYLALAVVDGMRYEATRPSKAMPLAAMLTAARRRMNDRKIRKTWVIIKMSSPPWPRVFSILCILPVLLSKVTPSSSKL